ncbi:AI-2E family transporter [Aquipuribacter sp. MA13-6]|uniref:AI-2E family transporter n=1 Tax=unclassified Aquipuribacter TaxID=2635084 RepID=UPI003EF03D48
MPHWLLRCAAYGAVLLVLVAVLAVLVAAALEVALVTFSLVVAVLLVALTEPAAGRLRRRGVPSVLAALLSLLVLVGVPVAILLLVVDNVLAQVDDLTGALTGGVETVWQWLVDGPLQLDADQVTALQEQATSGLQSVAPTLASGVLTGASTVGTAVTGTLFALVAVFFLLKDGSRMWAWLLSWVPSRHRERTDGAGQEAWTALTGYVRGTVVIAVVDAALIGTGLLLVGVPLWLPLTLLTFLAAFVPIVGAVVAGAAAVLVTLMTEGPTDAIIILVVVLLVQNVEGEILQPLVMGKALSLHPLAILTTVTCATLLLGIAGAVVAVPLVASAYKVASYLAGRGEAEQRTKEELERSSS